MKKPIKRKKKITPAKESAPIRESWEDIFNKQNNNFVAFIDATPDGKYAIRLLEACLKNTFVVYSETDNIKDPGKVKNPMLNYMNEINIKRREELEKAIRFLKWEQAWSKNL